MKTTHASSACKGVSLTEMTVVLTLVSIVSLLVVSFTMMVNLRSTVGVTKNRVADDLRLCKVVLENWIETITATYDADVVVSPDGHSLVATIDGVTYTTELTDDSFTAALPGSERLHCPLGEITAFSFEMLEKREDGQLQDAIWFCTAEYVLPQSDGNPLPQQTTFCINPHTGDTVR